MGSSKRKRKSESESNMSGTGDPSANLYSLDGKRIKTGFDSGNPNASSTLGPETGNPRGSPEKFESYLSETRFDRLSLSPMLLNGVKDLGYEKMTLVQEATLPAILQGKDVLAKAKTGMEKALAFSLPLIGIVLKFPRTSSYFKRPSAINVLVMCPNRELVNQVASEANNLLKYSPSFWCTSSYGR